MLLRDERIEVVVMGLASTFEVGWIRKEECEVRALVKGGCLHIGWV
jgi:hypothetical protein